METVLLLCCHMLQAGMLSILLMMELGKKGWPGRIQWVLDMFLMTGIELTVDALIYRFSLPWVIGIAHPAGYLIPFLWLGRKRLLESLFSSFLLLHYFMAVSYFSMWMFCYFTQLYGFMPTAFSILFMELLFGGFLFVYFKRIIMPMLLSEGSFACVWKLWLWLIPAAFYLISVYSCCIQSASDAPTGYTAVYMALYVLLDLFVCWIIGNFIKESEQANDLESERQLFSTMRKQYEGIQEKLEQAGQMRHDMRHFVIRVNGLLQEGDIEGIKDYLLEYSTALSQGSLKNITYCSDSTVNAVAGYYLLTAENEGIETRFDCRIDSELPVSDLEISGILGNLLENALEACRRMESGKRYIHVTLRNEKNGFLVLVVENSFDGTAKKKGDRFLSSKRNEPGIGLESVRKSVERRNGILKVEYEGQVFCVNVFIG